MRTINTGILILTLTLAGVIAEDSWNPFSVITEGSDNFRSFFDGQGEKMKSFLQDQKNKVEKVFSSGFENAKQMSNSVNNYVEEQHKKISDDINSYVDSVKESGRKASESWSYLPVEESGAQLQNPEAVLSVPSIIARNGYQCETHTVISEGYMLNIHRIPRSKTDLHTPSKTVLLHHGLFASSADWVLNGPDKSLAFTLADAGYDVWMANIRGNKYSREHASLKQDSKTYWNFSWHDVALYDVPAIIDYIMNLKGSSTKITYIGHSMGTAILFAMLTLRPEYNDILNAGIALAPVVFTSEIKSPLKSLAPVASNIAYMEMLYGSHEFIPKNSAMGKLSTSCDTSSQDNSAKVCKNAMFYICGYDEGQFDASRLQVFLAHLGTGTSWKTAVHFAQEIMSGGKFQQFDYGYTHNMKLYGSETPPEYDLSKVTLPVSLFWAKNDLLSSEQDVMMLYEKLRPESTELYQVPYPEFNHLDYLLAKDAPALVNDKVLKYLRKHDSNDYVVRFNF